MSLSCLGRFTWKTDGSTFVHQWWEYSICGEPATEIPGMEIQIPPNQQRAREIVIERHASEDGHLPNHSPSKVADLLHCCRRLSWLLMVQEFPLTWVKVNLEAVATAFLKKWPGLTKSASIALFIWDHHLGEWINHHSWHFIRSCKYLTNVSYWHVLIPVCADRHHQNKTRYTRKAFRQATEVRETMRKDIGKNRKWLERWVKARIQENDDEIRVADLLNHQRQGHMMPVDFINTCVKLFNNFLLMNTVF